MKLSNYKDVSKVIEVLGQIEKQIVRTDKYLTNVLANNPDSGGVTGFLTLGYNCHLSLHRDGSGDSVDMPGCYVAAEVAEAVLEVLNTKRERCLDWLVDMGVEV